MRVRTASLALTGALLTLAPAASALAPAASAMEPRVPNPERDAVPGTDIVFYKQEIARRTGEEWPFTVERGRLVCTVMRGMRVAWFEEVPGPRSVPLHANPFVLMFANGEEGSLLKRYPDPLIGHEKRLPFTTFAHTLCGDHA